MLLVAGLLAMASAENSAVPTAKADFCTVAADPASFAGRTVEVEADLIPNDPHGNYLTDRQCPDALLHIDLGVDFFAKLEALEGSKWSPDESNLRLRFSGHVASYENEWGRPTWFVAVETLVTAHGSKDPGGS